MPRFAGRARSSVSLSNSLRRDLALYGLAAGATGASLFASAQPAAAQIVYTPAHSELDHDGVIRIDLNHDGEVDLVIREIPHVVESYNGNVLQAVPLTGGGVKRGLSHGGAAAMAPGSIIGPRDPFDAGPAVMFDVYGIYNYGSWGTPGVADYLGIRFQINGETHYGWARMYVRFGFFSYIDALLTGYAYEAQPNKPIHAGDMGTGEADSAATRETSSLETRSSATLGALALGAMAIPGWRATAQ
jgi:hypothetical protein